MSDDSLTQKDNQKVKENEWNRPIRQDGDNNLTRGPQPENKPRDNPRPVKW